MNAELFYLKSHPAFTIAVQESENDVLATLIVKKDGGPVEGPTFSWRRSWKTELKDPWTGYAETFFSGAIAAGGYDSISREAIERVIAGTEDKE